MSGFPALQWRSFFLACIECLKPGDFSRSPSPESSWCAYTTFTRLESDAGYWKSGLPLAQDIGERGINDCGVWGQPFPFDDIAHVIIPRTIYWEDIRDGRWLGDGHAVQDIGTLSLALSAKGIEHSLTALVLEIKCY